MIRETVLHGLLSILLRVRMLVWVYALELHVIGRSLSS